MLLLLLLALVLLLVQAGQASLLQQQLQRQQQGWGRRRASSSCSTCRCSRWEAGCGAGHQPLHQRLCCPGRSLHAVHIVCVLLQPQVPWRIVAQLQAASTTGLRIVSPAVLRSLLRSTANQAEQSRGALRHPYETLSPSQAQALLEFCCSDLSATDEPPTAASVSDAAGSSAASAAAATPVDEAAAASSSAGPAAPQQQQQQQQAALPPGLEGAASVVADMFGAAGLAALGGLANQLQQRVGNMRSIDEVIGAVMDVMQSQPAAAAGGQQRQQQAPPPPVAPAGAAASSSSSRSVTAAGSSSGGSSKAPVNMQRVQALTGLPVVTAAGSIVVLGRVRLFVAPTGNGCPPPTALLPAQQQRSFVSPEIAASLGPWLFKHPEVRQQLKLEFLSLQCLAEHLTHTLAPTWTFAADAGSSGGGSSGGGGGGSSRGGPQRSLHHQPGQPGFPAVIRWDDGAAGGPLLDWLIKLWQVLLHIIAAAPEWERSMHSSSGSGGGPAAAADAAGGYLRSAAQRARGLVDVLAAEVAGALDPAAGATAAVHPAVAAAAAGAAATAADAQAEEALELWQPLLDWPLLPLADGRLLKLRHRELVLAVLPDYQQPAAGAVGAAPGPSIAAAASTSDEQVRGGAVWLCCPAHAPPPLACTAWSPHLALTRLCPLPCRLALPWLWPSPGPGYCRRCARQDSRCWTLALASSSAAQQQVAAVQPPRQRQHRCQRRCCSGRCRSLAARPS
jgi:hypothetical protein